MNRLKFVCKYFTKNRKLDKIEDVQNSYKDKIKLDINQEFAKRVAKNLYNYLDSFNQVYCI
jgi:uncharacterized FAD-dependent dehydrogenase